MFEDLVPSAQAATPAPPPGVFDDLIPAGAGADAAAAGKLAAPGGADEQALPRSTAGTDPGDESIQTPARDGQLAVALSGQSNARDDTSPSPGLFEDLIPAGARNGAAGGGAVGGMSSETEPSVGSVLKQVAIGVPEGALNMAAWDMIRDLVSSEPSLNEAAWESLRGVVALLGTGEDCGPEIRARFRRTG